VLDGKDRQQRRVDGERHAERRSRVAVETRRHAEAADKGDGVEKGPEKDEIRAEAVGKKRCALQHDSTSLNVPEGCARAAGAAMGTLSRFD